MNLFVLWTESYGEAVKAANHLASNGGHILDCSVIGKWSQVLVHFEKLEDEKHLSELQLNPGHKKAWIPGLKTNVIESYLSLSSNTDSDFLLTVETMFVGDVFDLLAMNAFNIYMAKGGTMPTSYLSMTLIYSGIAKSFEFTKTTVYSDPTGTSNLTDTSKIYRYAFTNDDLTSRPKLNGKDTFWFIVAARTTNKFVCIGGPGNCGPSYTPDVSSTQRAAIYVARVDEPHRELDVIDLSLTSNALQTSVYLNWQKEEFNECCYVVLRSRDGTNWTQLSAPFSAVSVTPATVEPVLDIKFVDNDPAGGGARAGSDAARRGDRPADSCG